MLFSAPESPRQIRVVSRAILAASSKGALHLQSLLFLVGGDRDGCDSCKYLVSSPEKASVLDVVLWAKSRKIMEVVTTLKDPAPLI